MRVAGFAAAFSVPRHLIFRPRHSCPPQSRCWEWFRSLAEDVHYRVLPLWALSGLERDVQSCPAIMNLPLLRDLEADQAVIRETEVSAVIEFSAAAVAGAEVTLAVGEQQPIRGAFAEISSRSDLGTRFDVGGVIFRQQHLRACGIGREEGPIPPEQNADARGRE